MDPKEDFKIDKNPKIINTFYIKYNNFLVYDNYFMIHSNDDKITLFQDFYKDIYISILLKFFTLYFFDYACFYNI